MLLDLLNYTSIADRIIINTFLKAAKPMPQAEHLFSHLLNTQHIWATRILGEPTSRDRFDVHPVTEFEAMQFENMKVLLDIYHTRDLSSTVIYSNSSGENFVNVLHDILLHVANHSTYHRAQIASQFKANGIEPPVTDYIFLKREGVF
jgi:uncharacterized damage-inducible protein DinB